MELFACDLHINQILVDNSIGGGGQGRGVGHEGVKGCLRQCGCVRWCMWGLQTPPLLTPCLAASLVH